MLFSGQSFWQIETGDKSGCLLMSRVLDSSIQEPDNPTGDWEVLLSRLLGTTQWVVVPDSATGKYIILQCTAPIVRKGIQDL